MQMEIAGHEFWSNDGKTIWYDLQAPRGEDFRVAGYDVQSHARTWRHLDRDEWSVHFNFSSDGKIFDVGVFRSERLVNMAKHDDKLEPNVSFTPDMKWIVFRSNMFGRAQVFAVEVNRK